ncbi:LexA family protein [Parasutterella sp.]|uniref:LexA family protein n=1 Tax=Parasutterella sp. TaxID=2049037 RepID=UPI003AEF6969
MINPSHAAALPSNASLPAIKPKIHNFPLFSSYVQAGFPSPAESYVDRTLDLNQFLIANPPSTFFVRVSGDSMNRAGLDEGDLLIVDRSLTPKNNDIVIMRVDSEFTVKRFNKQGEKIFLTPDSTNPVFKPLYPSEGQEWEVIGVVTYSIKKL